jgi:hypothetical protein
VQYEEYFANKEKVTTMMIHQNYLLNETNHIHNAETKTTFFKIFDDNSKQTFNKMKRKNQKFTILEPL